MSVDWPLSIGAMVELNIGGSTLKVVIVNVVSWLILEISWLVVKKSNTPKCFRVCCLSGQANQCEMQLTNGLID